jgi:hypothetical protein
MIKVSINELEMILKLVRSTSNDVSLQIAEDGYALQATFINSEGQITTAQVFSEESRCMPKVTTTENLHQVVTRLKGNK